MDAQAQFERLEANEKALSALLSSFAEESVRIKPGPDAWSALEVLCHLYDEEREDFRYRIDQALHQPGAEWPALGILEKVTERNYQGQDFAQVLAAWQEERAKSLEWLRGLQAPDWETAHESASSRRLRAGDLLAAWVAHDLLHLRQLVELRWAEQERLAAPYKVDYAGDW